MKLLKKIAGSPITRWVFLAIALVGLVWAVAKNWHSLLEALAVLPAWIAAVSILLAIVYVFFTLWSWKIILADLGSSLSWNASVQLFGVSQIGKYIPGGVWNIVAAAEIGRNHRIPARRSVTAMTVAVLISLLSGTGIGAVTVLGTSVTIQVPTWAIIVLLIILVALLTPPVLNRLIGFGFKLLKRPAPEHVACHYRVGCCRSPSLAVGCWIRHESQRLRPIARRRRVCIGLGCWFPCCIHACRNRRARGHTQPVLHRSAQLRRCFGRSTGQPHRHDGG